MAIIVVWLAITLAMAYGWVLNIVALVNFHGTLADAGMLEVLRMVGVFFAPLGVFLGYVF